MLRYAARVMSSGRRIACFRLWPVGHPDHLCREAQEWTSLFATLFVRNRAGTEGGAGGA